MRRPFAAVAVLGTATAVLALAGCGSSTGPNSSTSFKSLSAAQQQQFETAAVDEVVANVSSFASFTGAIGAFGFQRAVPLRTRGMFQILGSKHAPRFQTTNCQPNDGGNLNDEDQDGVRDNETLSESCVQSSNGSTDTVTVSITISDPTPTTADIDYNGQFDLGEGIHGGGNGDINLTLNGTSQLTETAGSLSESENGALDLSVTNSSNGNGTVKLTTNATASYTYSGPLLTSFGSLPDGTFDLTGNWTYKVNTPTLTANLSFKVTTPGGLSIKAACSNDGHIDSGEVDIKFDDGTLVKATWSGCPSQPSVTVS